MEQPRVLLIMLPIMPTDSLVTKKQIDSILDKIDSSLSLYKPYSLINQFNNSKERIGSR